MQIYLVHLYRLQSARFCKDLAWCLVLMALLAKSAANSYLQRALLLISNKKLTGGQFNSRTLRQLPYTSYRATEFPMTFATFLIQQNYPMSFQGFSLLLPINVPSVPGGFEVPTFLLQGVDAARHCPTLKGAWWPDNAWRVGVHGEIYHASLLWR